MKTLPFNTSYFQVNPLKSVNTEKTSIPKPIYFINTLKAYKPSDNSRANVLPLILNSSKQSTVKVIVNKITDNIDALDKDWFLNYE